MKQRNRREAEILASNLGEGGVSASEILSDMSFLKELAQLQESMVRSLIIFTYLLLLMLLFVDVLCLHMHFVKIEHFLTVFHLIISCIHIVRGLECLSGLLICWEIWFCFFAKS